MTIRNILGKQFIMFDGAMGTMLQKAGLHGGELPESYNITHPEIVKKIHKSYVQAGADIITTNTFQANEIKLIHSDYPVEEIIEAGVEIAKGAGAKFVALDMGPAGQLMEPFGEITFDQAYDIFSRQVKAGVKAGADLVLIETISDLLEAKAAILAVKENSSLPVFCTMTFEKNQRTLMGTDPLIMTTTLQSLGVDALGVNCSLGPKELLPIVEQLVTYAKVPVMVQPNAGLPKYDGEKTFYDITADEFAQYIKAMGQKGVVIFGGCCGTTPEYIKATKKVLQDLEPEKLEPQNTTPCICSARKSLLLKGSLVEGEGIDLDSKKVEELIKKRKLHELAVEAKKQESAGAQIIKIDVGADGKEKKELIRDVIKIVQGSTMVPIQIEGANIEAIGSGVRIYNGRPIIGVTYLTDEIIEKLIPLVKKYGTCLAITLSNQEQTNISIEDRQKITQKIIGKAHEFHIPQEDIIIN